MRSPHADETVVLAELESVPAGDLIGLTRSLVEAITAVHHDGRVHGRVEPGVVAVTGGVIVLPDPDPRVDRGSDGVHHGLDECSPTPADDVIAAAGIVRHLAGLCDPRLDRATRSAVDAVAERARRTGNLAVLVNGIEAVMTGPTPPSSEPHATRDPMPAPRRRLPLRSRLLLICVATVVLSAALLHSQTGTDSHDQIVRAGQPSPAPADVSVALACGTAQGCRTVVADPSCALEPATCHVAPVDIDGRSWRPARGGDLVSMGDVDCDGIADVVVTRPHTGLVALYRVSEDGTPVLADTAELPPPITAVSTRDRQGCARVLATVSGLTVAVPWASASPRSSPRSSDRTVQGDTP